MPTIAGVEWQERGEDKLLHSTGKTRCIIARTPTNGQWPWWMVSANAKQNRTGQAETQEQAATDCLQAAAEVGG